jgi:SPP1 gp7 family putative phage head morphogenesis protein
VRNKIVAMLDRTEESIASTIRDKLRSTGLQTPAEVKRLQSIQRTVELLREKAWSDATDFLLNQMEDLAYQEPLFTQNMFVLSAPVIIETVIPPAIQLKGIALSRPFEGRLLKEWAETMKADDLRRIHAAIQMGMIAGEGSNVIAKRVVGTGLLDGRDGMTEQSRRQVDTIVRTAVQHVANSVRAEFFELNSDIIEAEVFVATLDARTTPVCRGLDGKRFQVGKGPRPPIHMGCRSIRVAVFNDSVLGSRPANAASRALLLDEFTEEQGLPQVDKRSELPFGIRGKFDSFEKKSLKNLIGRVPASTTYDAWLRAQPHSFQNEILGITKAKLFRGGLTLDKYTAVNGTELTLAQLAVKYKDAFKSANLDYSAFLNSRRGP